MYTTDWPTGKYRAILADPAWSYQDSRCEGAAAAHYPTMRHPEICGMPVGELCEKDCVLFLWATGPKLPEALAVMKAWGFEYKTHAWVWVKTSGDRMEPKMGIGRWTQKSAEFCLLGTRGKPGRRAAGITDLIQSPGREHSRKPDEQYRRIEGLVEGPYLELFGRYDREGWTVWGNDPRPGQIEGAWIRDAPR